MKRYNGTHTPHWGCMHTAHTRKLPQNGYPTKAHLICFLARPHHIVISPPNKVENFHFRQKTKLKRYFHSGKIKKVKFLNVILTHLPIWYTILHLRIKIKIHKLIQIQICDRFE